VTDQTRPWIRLVATDLDGTIIRADGTVSPRVMAAISAVEELGLPVVFVTGRPPRWMEGVAHLPSLHGIAICANGALVYDLRNETVLERFDLEPHIALETVRRLRAVMPLAVFAAETADGFFHERAYVPRQPGGDTVQVEVGEELFSTPVAKLLVRDESSSGDQMLAVALQAVGDLATVTHSNPRDCLLEISAAGVTKATTLARVAAEHGVEADGVLAFGDQPNDVAMLTWAGTSYAMRGGHPDVLDAVSTHAESVEDDGVALVLERFMADGTIRSSDASDRGTRSG
jgi:Cof subfamily protein (haloacid dehalogenase superfamily)